MRRHAPAALLAVSLLLATASPAALACPNCRDSIANSDAPQATALPGGFNKSIYFMLGGVLVVGGFVVRMIVKEVRG